MNTPISIADIFPVFGSRQVARFLSESSPEERSELDFMFETAEIRYPKPSEHVLSLSLYCRPHDPGRPKIQPLTIDELRKRHPTVRKRGTPHSWWDKYFEPLIQTLDRVRSPWVARIYLAPDLLFLEPYLRKERVEIRVMRHNSENAVPGMLWRYLPLEEGIHVMAGDADDPWPGKANLSHICSMLSGSCRLFRRICPRDLNAAGVLGYRTVPGVNVVKAGPPLPFLETVKAWIWHQQRQLWPKAVRLPWMEHDVPKFGLAHWSGYAQDEQFLSHWLYHALAPEGIYSIVGLGQNSQLWPLDRQYLLEKSPHSIILEHQIRPSNPQP